MSESEKGKKSSTEPINATGDSGTGDPDPRSPEEIRSDIEETREDLGETVAAVAGKADVKAQAKKKADGIKEQASAKVEELKRKASVKAKEMGEKAQDAAPESADQGVRQAGRTASENPVPLAIAGALIAGFLLGRLLSR